MKENHWIIFFRLFCTVTVKIIWLLTTTRECNTTLQGQDCQVIKKVFVNYSPVQNNVVWRAVVTILLWLCFADIFKLVLLYYLTLASKKEMSFRSYKELWKSVNPIDIIITWNEEYSQKKWYKVCAIDESFSEPTLMVVLSGSKFQKQLPGGVL